MNAEKITEILDLQTHPEGGFYKEIYRSKETIPHNALPGWYESGRAFGTAIYYMLTSETFSAMHRLKTDEIWHFYLGDPLDMLLLYPDGRAETKVLGTNLETGEHPQILVPQGAWQGARVTGGGAFTLVGCTMAPGFDFADFELGERDKLIKQYPGQAVLITQLTK